MQNLFDGEIVQHVVKKTKPRVQRNRRKSPVQTKKHSAVDELPKVSPIKRPKYVLCKNWIMLILERSVRQRNMMKKKICQSFLKINLLVMKYVKPLDQNISSMPAQLSSNQSLQNVINTNRDIAGHCASGNASLANITPSPKSLSSLSSLSVARWFCLQETQHKAQQINTLRDQYEFRLIISQLENKNRISTEEKERGRISDFFALLG